MEPMNKVHILLFIAAVAIIWGCEPGRVAATDDATDQSDTAADFDTSAWREERVTADDLLEWHLLGEGKATKVMGEQVALEETDQSQGVMLLSPASYLGDVVVRYRALALSPAAVFVTVLSARDVAGDQLTIPAGYDGTMGLWTTATSNYFFAFKNASHGATPFIMRNPGAEQLAAAAEQDRMAAGIYYTVEQGREGQKLWLSIDGERVVEARDESPLAGGRIALRLRGTAGLRAVGLIKDLTIFTKP